MASVNVLIWDKADPLTLSNNIRCTLSWGADIDGQVVCGRIDLRQFTKTYPTKRGVTLKKSDLEHLADFLHSFDMNQGPEEVSFWDFTITRHGYDSIILRKRNQCLELNRKTALEVYALIPAFVYLLGYQKEDAPNGEENSNLLAQLFILTRIVGDVSSVSLAIESGVVPKEAADNFRKKICKHWMEFKEVFAYPLHLIDPLKNKFIEHFLELADESVFIKGVRPFYESDKAKFMSIALYVSKVVESIYC